MKGLPLFLLIFLVPLTLFASTFEALSKGDQAALLQNSVLVKELPESEGPWPTIIIYTVIEANYVEAAAIFSAYHFQKDFVPNVISSNPVHVLTPTDIHMSYEMKMPWPLSNTRYTTGNQLTFLEAAKEYTVRWYYVDSEATLDNKGSASFAPFEEKKTLFRYQTYVKPKSIFAKLLRGKMKSDVEMTIRSISKYIEKTSRENPTLTKSLLVFMNESLSGKDKFSEMIKK